MEKYRINYNTGAEAREVEGYLDEVKEIAQEGIAYTQQDITIETLEGEVVAVTRWYGLRPSEEDYEAGYVLEEIGGGFYGNWEEY